MLTSTPVPTVPDDKATAVGVELRALCPVGAVVDGRVVDLGPPKQRALFALLLSRVDRPVAVDTLIEELWSGEPPAAAMASLLAYVCNLRRVLEPHRPPRAPAAVLRTRAPGYVLDSRGAEVDVRRFIGHATAGHEARANPQQALREFDAALGLWRGQAYADVRDAAWATPEIARLEDLRLSVIEGRLTALLELGAHQVAVAELEVHARVGGLLHRRGRAGPRRPRRRPGRPRHRCRGRRGDGRAALAGPGPRRHHPGPAAAPSRHQAE